MIRPNVPRYVQFGFVAVLGFTSVVEMSHFRHYLAKRNWERMAFTLIAASASAYMASEALDGNYPTWGN